MIWAAVFRNGRAANSQMLHRASKTPLLASHGLLSRAAVGRMNLFSSRAGRESAIIGMTWIICWFRQRSLSISRPFGIGNVRHGSVVARDLVAYHEGARAVLALALVFFPQSEFGNRRPKRAVSSSVH